MNRILNLSLILILALSMSKLSAQKQVYPMPLDSNIKLSANYFYYQMPTTAIKVHVTVTKVREIKGYYADQAEKLLGLTNIISDNRTFYKLKNVSIETVQVPDTKLTFAVEPSSQQVKEQAYAKAFLKSQNTQNDVFEETYSTQVKGIPDFFQNYANVNYTETEDAFVETKIINGVVTQVPANRTRLVNKSAEQKVQEAADRITQIRKDRNSLIAGEQEVAYTKEALDLMITQLNQAENDYLDLFRGIVLEDDIHYTLYVIPEKNTAVLPLFELDQNTGFKATTSASEANYSLKFSDFGKALKARKQEGKTANKGFRVRHPQAVYIDLLHYSENAHRFGIYQLLQWGEIEVLPVNLDPELESVGFVF